MKTKNFFDFSKITNLFINKYVKEIKPIFILITIIQFIFLNFEISETANSYQKSKSQKVILTNFDISMAKKVIQENTMSIPGLGIGSRVKISSGNFSVSDALVLYMLKFHQQTKICPSIVVVSATLKQINDSNVNKKAVAIFWKDYSTTSGLDKEITKHDFLKSSFEWYILTKQTERLKITNARLQGFVGSDESWRRAMNSQQKFWEKSKARENEFILKRDAYRVILDTQAAIYAAERAVKSGY